MMNSKLILLLVLLGPLNLRAEFPTAVPQPKSKKTNTSINTEPRGQTSNQPEKTKGYKKRLLKNETDEMEGPPGDPTKDESQKHYRELVPDTNFQGRAIKDPFEALRVALWQKVKTNTGNGQLSVVLMSPPREEGVKTNMAKEIVKGISRSMRRTGMRFVRIEPYYFEDETQENFEEAADKLIADILISVKIEQRYMVVFLYDVRTPKVAFAYRQEIPDPRFHRYTQEAWNFYSSPAIKYLFYFYIQDRSQPLPVKSKKKRKNIEQSWSTDGEVKRHYTNLSLGMASLKGVDSSSLSKALMSAKIGRYLSKSFSLELGIEHFGFTGAQFGVRYESGLSKKKLGVAGSLSALYVMNRLPNTGPVQEPLGAASFPGLYIVPALAGLYEPTEDLRISLEAKYFYGSGTSGLGASIGIQTLF